MRRRPVRPGVGTRDGRDRTDTTTPGRSDGTDGRADGPFEPDRSLRLRSNGDFLRLWAGQTVSQLGTQITFLALPLVAIVALGASAFEVGLLGALEWLPFLFFALPAGAWLDRLHRRPILIAADIGRALTLASIPAAFALGRLELPQLYVVAFVNGSLTVFFDVGYQSYLPSLVERRQIAEANGKLEMSYSGAQIAGPGLGGLLIGLLSAPVAILGDAISYLVSAAFLLRIRGPEQSRGPAAVEGAEAEGVRAVEGAVASGTATPERLGLRREIGEGLRFVVSHPYLRAIAACTATLNLFGLIAMSIYLVFAVRELGLSPELIGGIMALGNVGGLLGAAVASKVGKRLGVGRTIVIAAAAGAPTLLIVAVTPKEFPIPFLVAYGFLGGLGTLIYNVNQVSFRQSITPDRLLGRMNATIRFIVTGTVPIGMFIGGVLGSTIGLRPTIVVGAVGTMLAVVPLLLSPVRRLRSIDDDNSAVGLRKVGVDGLGGGVSRQEPEGREAGS